MRMMTTTAASDFGATVIQRRGDVVVTPLGYAGFHQAEALSEALAGVLARRPRRVVLDLSRLDFISSAATGVLVCFRRALARHGARVTVISPPDGIHSSGDVCHTRT